VAVFHGGIDHWKSLAEHSVDELLIVVGAQPPFTALLFQSGQCRWTAPVEVFSSTPFVICTARSVVTEILTYFERGLLPNLVKQLSAV